MAGKSAEELLTNFMMGGLEGPRVDKQTYAKGTGPKGVTSLKQGEQYKVAKDPNNLMDIHNNKLIKKGRSQYAAMGTGTEGVETEDVEVEGKEVLKSPDGEETIEMEGPSHEYGGIPIEAEVGTKIFSDQVKVEGETIAKRELKRTARLIRIEKLLEKDPTDLITKQSYERTKAQNEYEAEGDLMVQEYAKKLDSGMDQGMKKFAKGGIVEGLGDFFSGFSPGDYLGLAGNAYQGMTALSGAKRNAAMDTPNENLYKGFADEALQTMGEAEGLVGQQQAAAKKDIQIARNRTKGRGRAQSRGINQMRSADLAADVSTNKAMEDMYSNFSKMMMENLYKKSGVQMQAGQIEAQGATAADIANRMDKDINDTNLGIAQNTMGQAIQMTGKDINANKKNRILTDLAGQLSKYGLTYEGGTIVKNKDKSKKI